MKYQHLRNATGLLHLGEHRLLIDPMLAAAGSMPGFKLFGGSRRDNPLVEMPDGATEVLETATGLLVTHEHPDHFDPEGLAFARDRGLRVWCAPIDVANLRKKGLDAHAVEDGVLGMRAETIEARHGSGFFGWAMGPVTSFYLSHPGEPGVLLTGDSVLTETLMAAIERLRPEVIVAPAGSANFGLGKDILFSVDELVEMARRTEARFVFNHLEALDHCPTTRTGLRERMEREGLLDRVSIPVDGEVLELQATGAPHVAPAAQPPRVPGFQKWFTARFAGT